MLAFNDQNLVQSGWKSEAENNVVQVERVSTHAKGDTEVGASNRQGNVEEVVVSNRGDYAFPPEEKYRKLAQDDWDAKAALKPFAWW